MTWLAVILGGALGTAARHAINLAAARVINTPVPYATATVNMVGSLVIGVLAGALAAERMSMSPFARTFDPARLPRIQAVERDLGYWLSYFEKNPQERFVSDGDPATVTVPTAARDRLRGGLPRDLKVVAR